MSTHRSGPRLVAVGLTGLALAAGALSTTPTSTPSAAASTYDAAPALLVATSDARFRGTQRGIAGEHQQVRLRASALPSRAGGQRLAVPLRGETGYVTIDRVDRVDREGGTTAWAGGLEGERLSSFSLVRVGDTFRGSLISPAGVYTLTSDRAGDHWWTAVAPRRGAEGRDTTSPHAHADHGATHARSSGDAPARSARRSKINLLFAYTKAVEVEAGGKEQLKASAALVVSQTNETFRNSGLPVEVRYRGLVKAKGKESADTLTNLKRQWKPRDGHFDNLHKARRKNKADLVHLFTTGSQYEVCGSGNLPLTVRDTHPTLGWSNSFHSCMPYLVATHEIGHNLGADHIGYDGVDRYSKIPYSYAYYNVPGGYLTVMGYYDPCVDAQVYTCVRLPWLSSPTNTWNGQPLGVGRVTDNARVVAKIAPRVARYVR